MKKPKRTLISQGILLVAAPFAMQSLLAISLILLLQSVQAQVLRESHVRNLLAQTYLISISIPELAALLLLQKQSMGYLSEGKVEKFLEKTEGKMTHLCESVGQNPDQTENIRKLEKSRQDLDYISRHLPGAVSIENDAKFQAEVCAKVNNLFDTLNNVINAERVQLLSAPAERDFLRNCILFSLGVAILMSVVLAAMLSRMYTARITKPLECLSENAKKLSKNDPLSEVRSDYAEMNSLDGTLREVESLLAKARTNEQSLIQNAAQLICTIDKSLRVESANDACLNILGRQPETIKDQLITQYLKSEETEMLLQNLKAARNSSTGQEFELEMENNNKLDPVFTKWSVLWSELEQKYFCIIHDISGRKQWEQLRQSYLNMISDDIRKPLEEVQTTLDSVSSDILQRELSVDPVARRNSKWLLELVCDLLDYENLQAGKLNFQMQLCKMDEILSRALSIASPLAKPRNIDFIQTGSECMVYGDEKKLVQLFANVLVNAVKFSPECGKIQINRTQLDKYVMISIIDEGEGISADLQQRLFQPFEQDDKKQDRQKGIGLGLAICKLIADSHHAQIGIDSDENHGTTFWLKIPTTEL